jgi:hypothetical protein
MYDRGEKLLQTLQEQGIILTREQVVDESNPHSLPEPEWFAVTSVYALCMYKNLPGQEISPEFDAMLKGNWGERTLEEYEMLLLQINALGLIASYRQMEDKDLANQIKNSPIVLDVFDRLNLTLAA